MSLIFYSEEEENKKEESIDKYKDLFLEYQTKEPSISEALEQMFIYSNVEKDIIKELVEDIISKSKETITGNLDKIKEKYPKITEEDAIIISSYTCESKNENYSPYRILNTNLVSENRKNGLKNISKYLYIFLNSLRKLTRYYPDSNNKYLYRCIRSKINYMIDPFNNKSEPYINGHTKIFWGFTSTSPNIKMTYDFLDKKKDVKSGTVFTLYGDVWGYDITLFNFYKEEEILLEPERKFVIDQIYPPLNEVIHVRCQIQKTPLVLYFKNNENINNTFENNFHNSSKDKNPHPIIVLAKEKKDKNTYMDINFKKNKSEISIDFKQMKNILDSDIANCVCKIKIVSNNRLIMGSGFFCEIPSKKFKFLVTDSVLLDERTLIELKTLKISDHKNKEMEINFELKRLKLFNKELNYTIIEILKNDKIQYFFPIEESINLEINEKIFCFHFSKRENLTFSTGRIIKIKDNNVFYSIQSESGSSGSPIILLEEKKLIGMHIGSYRKDGKNIRFGLLISSIYNDIIDKCGNFIRDYNNSYGCFIL